MSVGDVNPGARVEQVRHGSCEGDEAQPAMQETRGRANNRSAIPAGGSNKRGKPDDQRDRRNECVDVGAPCGRTSS